VETRRNFLKRSAYTSALVWTAPVVTTLPSGAAWADQYQPTGVCQMQATGLYVLLGNDLVFRGGYATDPTEGERCSVRVGQTRDHDPNTYECDTKLGRMRLAAEVICGQVFGPNDFGSGGQCRAAAHVASLQLLFRDPNEYDDDRPRRGLTSGVRHLRFELLQSDTRGSTDATVPTSGTTNLASVTTQRGLNAQTLFLAADCNFNVSVWDVVKITANEQFCSDGCLTVRALRIDVPAKDGRALRIVCAETSVQGAGPCRTCS
jgi:hypothetical protein